MRVERKGRRERMGESFAEGGYEERGGLTLIFLLAGPSRLDDALGQASRRAPTSRTIRMAQSGGELPSTARESMGTRWMSTSPRRHWRMRDASTRRMRRDDRPSSSTRLQRVSLGLSVNARSLADPSCSRTTTGALPSPKQQRSHPRQTPQSVHLPPQERQHLTWRSRLARQAFE